MRNDHLALTRGKYRSRSDRRVQAIRDLAELARKGGTVQATCRICGKVALFSPAELAGYFARRNWDGSWPRFATRLRCAGTGGCGACGPKVASLVDGPPPDHDPLPPRPRLVRGGTKPRPVDDPSEWELARQRRERRRGTARARRT